MFVPNFKFLGGVVPEKSLKQISLSIKFECEMEKSRKKKRKRRQNKFKHHDFLVNKILQAYIGVYSV